MPSFKDDRPRDAGWVNAYYRISDGARRYRLRRGTLPLPDGHVGRRPFWYESTIRQHQPRPAEGGGEL